MQNACQLTALEIARNIDTLPRAGAAAKDTTGCPSGPVVRTGAAADPALLDIARLLSGTRSRCHALAVADDRWGFAHTLLRVVLGLRRESVRALESAGVIIDTGRDAVIGVNTVRRAGGIDDLRNNQNRCQVDTLIYQRTSSTKVSETACFPAIVTA